MAKCVQLHQENFEYLLEKLKGTQDDQTKLVILNIISNHQRHNFPFSQEFNGKLIEAIATIINSESSSEQLKRDAETAFMIVNCSDNLFVNGINFAKLDALTFNFMLHTAADRKQNWIPTLTGNDSYNQRILHGIENNEQYVLLFIEKASGHIANTDNIIAHLVKQLCKGESEGHLRALLKLSEKNSSQIAE